MVVLVESRTGSYCWVRCGVETIGVGATGWGGAGAMTFVASSSALRAAVISVGSITDFSGTTG